MVEGRAEPHRVVEDERDGQTTSHYHGRLSATGIPPRRLPFRSPLPSSASADACILAVVPETRLAEVR